MKTGTWLVLVIVLGAAALGLIALKLRRGRPVPSLDPVSVPAPGPSRAPGP